MADLFEAVELVNRLTELRGNVKGLLGANYDARVKDYVAIVRTFPEAERWSRVVSLATDLKANGFDAGATFLMCAAVEVTEQKTPAVAHAR